MPTERLYRALLDRSEDGIPQLSADELKHLVRVRRARPGERFLGLVEGQGWYLCRLQQTGERWEVELVEPIVSQSASNFFVTLAPAVIKRDRFEWMLQKATELGVDRIVPLLTRHATPGAKALSEKQARRWRRILLESVKQCGRDSIPELESSTDLTGFLDRPRSDLQFFLDEAGGVGLPALTREVRGPQEICFVVGPEGGWSDDEREQLRESGFTAVSLGSVILRAETVPLAVLSVLQFVYGSKQV